MLQEINPQAEIVKSTYAVCDLGSLFESRFLSNLLKDKEEKENRNLNENLHTTMVHCMIKFPASVKFDTDRLEEELAQMLWQEQAYSIERIKALFRATSTSTKWTLQALID